MTQLHHRLSSQITGAEIGRNRQAGVRPADLETRDLSRLFAVRANISAVGTQVLYSRHASDAAQQVLPDVWKDGCLS